jgi:hypothetical protein
MSSMDVLYGWLVLWRAGKGDHVFVKEVSQKAIVGL